MSSNYAYYLIDDVCVSTSAQTCSDGTGIMDQSSHEGINNYPDPNNGNFNVEYINYRHNEDLTLTITNAFGQKLKEMTLKERLNTVKLDKQAGLYFLNVVGRKGNLTTKFIIHH